MMNVFSYSSGSFIGLPESEGIELKRDMQSSRNYLKSDYKVHISPNSSVPDHCSTFALSDNINKCWNKQCDHPHDQICDRCQLLQLTLGKIQSLIEKYHKDIGLRDRMLHRWRQQIYSIEQWKSHLLRTVHQDHSRIDHLNFLDDETVMIYVDWAMKWLPVKYRESTVIYNHASFYSLCCFSFSSLLERSLCQTRIVVAHCLYYTKTNTIVVNHIR